MKFSPYSFSKISTHQSCARKFKYSYIDKVPRENADRTALFKGSALHNILENYPNPGTHKLAPQYQYIIDDFLKMDKSRYLNFKAIKELAIGLDENLQPCEYSKQAMFRGYIDYFTVKDNEIIIVDWKSGKLKDPKYQDYNQLMYYAIYMFKKYSKVQKIHISYVYIEHDYENTMVLERKYLDNYCNSLLSEIQT